MKVVPAGDKPSALLGEVPASAPSISYYWGSAGPHGTSATRQGAWPEPCAHRASFLCESPEFSCLRPRGPTPRNVIFLLARYLPWPAGAIFQGLSFFRFPR